MPYTADRLKLLRVPQLKEILDEMSLTTIGLKLDLIERIVTDQVDHQDVTLYMSGPPATSASVGIATAVVIPTPTISQDTIADLVQHLELRPKATKTLEDAGFTSGSDVKLMTSEEVGSLGLLFGDVLKIRQWLESAKPITQIMHSHPLCSLPPSSTTVLHPWLFQVSLTTIQTTTLSKAFFYINMHEIYHVPTSQSTQKMVQATKK
ncbi:hypothetical protein BV898_18389 [Hypsibius exemplaris]|uniref:SAP domain-containing protein n=1 Tax=Hypsibius exemplaris TaxID=2072580 RepID=A0A9X6NP27_HYPEX|nr:hypothetical protein BV898_18389 [Hypsibius exemplaris]